MMAEASEFRKVDVGDRVLDNVPDAGAPPRLDWLPISRLLIDDVYQRPIMRDSWPRIVRIAKAFTWSHFAPVIAAPIPGGGGDHVLIDGQHRVHAARLVGFDNVPAMIVSLPREAQARAFGAINGEITGMTIFHIYKAALAANESWARDCRDVVAAAGCRLMGYPSGTASRKPRDIYCIGKVRELVRGGRAEVVRLGLAALVSGAPDAGPDMYASRLLGAWWAALIAVDGALSLDLADIAARSDLVALHDRSHSLSRQPEYRGQSVHKLLTARISGLLRRRLAQEGGAQGAGTGKPLPPSAALAAPSSSPPKVSLAVRGAFHGGAVSQDALREAMLADSGTRRRMV